MGNGRVGDRNMGNRSLWIAACRREHVDESCEDGSRGDGSRGDGSRGDRSRGDRSRGDGSRGEGSRRDWSCGDGSQAVPFRSLSLCSLFSDYIFFCWAWQEIICFLVCFWTTYFFVGHGKQLFVS